MKEGRIEEMGPYDELINDGNVNIFFSINFNSLFFILFLKHVYVQLFFLKHIYIVFSYYF